ncbi:MAG: hypothetical protein KC486_13135 [Myxococcales bacterium]|nr:hypothetical protein [Myxococcales bacterium]
MIGAALLATTLVTEPPSQPEPPAPPPPVTESLQRSEGSLSVAILEREAIVAKRRRRARGALGLGLGAAQVSLGVYGLTSPRFDRVMRRSALAQLLLGTSTLGLGIVSLARPSPLERLCASDTFAALAADPDDPAAMLELRRLWAQYANRARKLRLMAGGGYIAGGLGLLALGTITHFHNAEERADVETLWSFTTLGTGLGLILTGAVGATIESQIERSYEAFAIVYGWPAYPTAKRPPRRARVRVAPLVGGLQITGSF